jgi:hypothetical protein
MGKLEKQLLESSIERPLSWYRFIDDVDMKWTQMKNYRSFFHVNQAVGRWNFNRTRFPNFPTGFDAIGMRNIGAEGGDIHSDQSSVGW